MGKSYVIREGSDVTIAACGSLVDEAQKAADLLAIPLTVQSTVGEGSRFMLRLNDPVFVGR